MQEDADRPPPRSSTDIFADLKTLAREAGALHEISFIIYRDWGVTVDTKKGRVTDDLKDRWSTSKLNSNELMLLLGLMVQSTDDRTYTLLPSEEPDFADRADRLLREFHDRVLADFQEPCTSSPEAFLAGENSLGLLAREAIYYGAETFYYHQLLKLSRQRYREDTHWLLQNVGLSIRPMIDIARFMVTRISKQMAAVHHLRREGQVFTKGELASSLLIAKADLRKEFRAKADAFLAKFSTPITGANASFAEPFAINGLAIAPIIDVGDYLYLPNGRRLYESVYESPFYWMLSDPAYCETAAKNRGIFLEKTAAQMLVSVFGISNVYENVTIHDGSKDTVGEVDVVVVYGEYVLFVQAKSKRVTQKARAGDTTALRKDFQDAVQAPYEQALMCADAIGRGARCITSDGRPLDMPSLPRLFPLVVLSDPFPSLTFLSKAMLQRGDAIAPVVWDLGVLDVVTRLLPTPIEMIFYLKCRSEVFDHMASDSEYNFLGYHIDQKLVMPSGVDFMTLDRAFATPVDDYMISIDMELKTSRPLGILERVNIPVVSEVLAVLKKAPPRLASVVIDLYDFSSAALNDLSKAILDLRKEVTSTRKHIKAISIPTRTGGLTYAVCLKRDERASRAAASIGSKHKYETKSNRWYVILDCVETDIPIDGLLPLLWPWSENEADAQRAEEVTKLFRSHRAELIVGQSAGAKEGPEA